MINQYRYREKRVSNNAEQPQMRGGECCALPARERSLAMVYPVAQSFEELYPIGDALYAGTLFKQLDKPFHKGFRI